MISFRILLILHASYILLTALWPLIDIHSFMVVTGPKEDVWLVKTVGALLIPVGLSLLMYLKSSLKLPAIVLGGGTAVSFIVIDLSYALNDTISNIYLADAAVEFFFLVGWIMAATSNSKALVKPN